MHGIHRFIKICQIPVTAVVRGRYGIISIIIIFKATSRHPCPGMVGGWVEGMERAMRAWQRGGAAADAIGRWLWICLCTELIRNCTGTIWNRWLWAWGAAKGGLQKTRKIKTFIGLRCLCLQRVLPFGRISGMDDVALAVLANAVLKPNWLALI